MPQRWRLTVVVGRATGLMLELGDELVIGREAEGEARLGEDPALSRRHARVVRDGEGRPLIEDLQSTNGTFVNGRRVSAQVLAHGDRIRVGDSELELAAAGEPPEPAPGERLRTQVSTAPPVAGMERAELRELLPALAEAVQLDVAGAGPLPRPALDAARAALEERLRGGGEPGARREALRAALAPYLAATPADVALVPSVADGVAALVAGWGLRRFDQVLLSDEEPPELVAPLVAAAARLGIELRAVAVEDLAAAVGPRTRLVVCSHVSAATGGVADLAALVATNAAVVVDATRSAGCLAPDPALSGCDAVLAGAGAWLCGPPAVAALRLEPGAAERVGPSAPASAALADPHRPVGGWRAGAARLDAGGDLEPAFAWALASLELLSRAGPAWLAHEAPRLAGRLAELLAARGRAVAPRGRSAIVAWRDADPEAACARLRERGIVAAPLPAHGLVRASVGAWATEDELERAAEAA